MKLLSIDIETYSPIDLRTSGVYRYANHPDFEILLFGYAFDDQPVNVIDLASGETLPDEVICALVSPDVIKTAFNANFERTCIAAYTGMDMPPEQWSCTAVRASELGLPASLENVGTVLGLKEDEQKLKTGKNLIKYFCRPCKPTQANNRRTRNLPQHDPARWDMFKEYNCRDVITERAIRKKLSRFDIPKSEERLWAVDQRINDRGVRADVGFARNAVMIDTIIKNRQLREAIELTGLENPKSPAQIKAWIQETAGITVESLNKRAIPTVRKDANNADVDRLLDLRAQLSKTSVKKYRAVLRTVDTDGRIRGLTKFYGANRTGRWSGRLVQLQNLPKNQISNQELDIARQFVSAGDIESIELLYDDVAGTLSQLVRTTFIPKEGCRFIVADFSAIEARVLAWMAGEKWRMDVFKSHGKIYEASAEQMFHLPTGSVKKGDPMRQKGKIAELALGYGGSVGALKSMGALDMGLQESELKPLVDKWRAANKSITKFWWDTDAAARRTINTKAPARLQYGMAFLKRGPLLKFKLPSGRELSYVKPAILEDQITYEGITQGGGWGRIETYGPKLVENIVQAFARDCLAEAIVRLEKKGFPVVFHVHDEVICEVPEGVSSAKELSEIMSEPIDWAPGLPLRADAYECYYYMKD